MNVLYDNRVTINKYLSKGKYMQCFGCRHPLTQQEMRLSNYKEGIHCCYCVNTRTKEQKKRSEQDKFKIKKSNKLNLINTNNL